jgi:hypothetical protein
MRRIRFPIAFLLIMAACDAPAVLAPNATATGAPALETADTTIVTTPPNTPTETAGGGIMIGSGT